MWRCLTEPVRSTACEDALGPLIHHLGDVPLWAWIVGIVLFFLVWTLLDESLHY